MTVEAFTPTPAYVIAGRGPYSVLSPYCDDDDLVVGVWTTVETVDVWSQLSPGDDYAVAPAAALAGGGAVTLTAAAATARAGGRLTIARRTRIEQGWQGRTSREVGLERQIDRLAMAIQDREFPAPYLVTRTRDLHLADDFQVHGNDNEGALVNERAGLQVALATAAATRQRLIVPATQYLVDGPGLTLSAGVELVSHGGQAKIWGGPALAAAGGTILSISGSAVGPEATWMVDRAIQPGERSIHVAANGDLLRPGMIFCLRSDAIWPYDGRGPWIKGETHVIERLVVALDTSAEIHLRGVTRDHYALDENLRLNVGRLLDVWIDGLSFEHQVGAIGTGGLRLSRCRGELRNVHARRCGFAGVAYLRCTQITELGGGGERIGCLESDGYVGYARSVISCQDMRFDGQRVHSSRRAIDLNGGTTAGPTRDVLYTNFYIEGGGEGAIDGQLFAPEGAMPVYAIGMHGPCADAVFAQGKIVDCDSGVTVRGLDTTIRDVEFLGRVTECIYATYGEGLHVEGCKASSLQGSKPLTTADPPAPDRFITFGAGTTAGIRWDSGRPTTVVMNTFHGLADAFIMFENQPVMQNLTCWGNTLVAGPGSGTKSVFKCLLPGDATEIRNGVIGPNYIQRQYSSGLVQLLGQGLSLGVAAGLDNYVDLGGGRYAMTIPNDDYKILRLGFVAALADIAVRVSVVAADSSHSCEVLMRPNNATPVSFGHVGSNVEFSAVPVTGTTGTVGKLTLALTSSGLIIENRRGGPRALIITIS